MLTSVLTFFMKKSQIVSAVWVVMTGISSVFWGRINLEVDPIKHARKMIAHIDKKREALGINKARERIMMDMATRRDLESA
mgnify:CR=1 FL=1